MNWLNRKRIRQVLRFGWIDAKTISSEAGKDRLSIFFDIVRCFNKYYLFSNQYKSKKLWLLNKSERQELGNTMGKENIYHDEWVVKDHEEKRFLCEYSSMKYETSARRMKKRLNAYTKRYNLGKGASVSHGVHISKKHFMDGEISIGDHVLLSREIDLDYSGKLTIGNNVQITEGVKVLTHCHPAHSDYRQTVSKTIPTNLVICDGAVLGTRAIVLSSCHYIGKYARVGAGSVVTHDVPDYAVVAGVPAKVIKIQEHEWRKEK